MKNFGFGEKWVRWIKICTSSAKISVLVNESPSDELTPQKGLWQGNLLSPFLFNIVAKGLNTLIEKEKELGFVKGATVGPNELKVSHLQFADDTIIFCEADRIGQYKENFKSVVCGVGVNEEDINDFVSILHCYSQKLPIAYLGIPLGANPRRKSTWNPVIEKVKHKLASWKRKMLSFIGRLTLVKAVLSSLPLYFLSIFKLPVGVAKQLDRIQPGVKHGSYCEECTVGIRGILLALGKRIRSAAGARGLLMYVAGWHFANAGLVDWSGL
ncbi:uncharacterized protein LOC114256647 [Camellia sinensis]|uniref:uncharacterized protein LOC114256647 n=1 Tax=Camellia sinensis TaxID=4442 RepID=UPI001035C5D8|nr:uncharacterized protein LOC114256647 [Camellia sinensis]